MAAPVDGAHATAPVGEPNPGRVDAPTDATGAAGHRNLARIAPPEQDYRNRLGRAPARSGGAQRLSGGPAPVRAPRWLRRGLRPAGGASLQRLQTRPTYDPVPLRM